ncbi:hypothetical protein [Paenibacillus sp.]|uniref:hypothetical protein n=1 Tax=Paenibacillus sp. TaxID=58172 RepID=UPI0034640526
MGETARLITPLGYVGSPAEMEQVNMMTWNFVVTFIRTTVKQFRLLVVKEKRQVVT